MVPGTLPGVLKFVPGYIILPGMNFPAFVFSYLLLLVVISLGGPLVPLLGSGPVVHVIINVLVNVLPPGVVLLADVS